MSNFVETMVLDADDMAAVETAARLLESGGIVGVPTETVYGLAANANNGEAVKKIYIAKGRPSDNPLILHICSLKMLNSLAAFVPAVALKLAEKYWPGPLTMIFKKNPCVPDITTGGLDTVAVRMPANNYTLALIERCGFPLAAPSANISGLPSPTEAAHVVRDMDGKIPLIIDGGKCEFGVESTVICFGENQEIKVLRPGAITLEMLEKFGKVEIDSGVLASIKPEQKVISPGMKYKHYSPKADVFIIEAVDNESFINYVNSHADNNTFVLAKFYSSKLKPRTLPYGGTAEEEAAALFSSLREADDEGAETVFVQSPDVSGIGLAVYNRLLRAAAFKIIKV